MAYGFHLVLWSTHLVYHHRARRVYWLFWYGKALSEITIAFKVFLYVLWVSYQLSEITSDDLWPTFDKQDHLISLCYDSLDFLYTHNVILLQLRSNLD